MTITKKYIDKNFWRKYVVMELLSGKKIYGKINALRGSASGNARMEIVDAHFIKQDGSMKPKNNSWKFSKSWIRISTVKEMSLFAEGV